MASAKQRRAPFIAHKLKFLKDQGELLIGAIGQYVSGIITVGETWTEGKDIDYMELGQMIDSAVDFLTDKCGELAVRSADVAANQLSIPPDEQSDMTSQPATTATLASATSYRQHTESVHPADQDQLKPVLARIAVIEEAWCSFRSNAENIPRQCDIDQQLKELLSKLLESDKKHKSKLRKVKEQISEIKHTQVALHEEQETRLQSLEKQLQKLSTEQDRMKDEIESRAELTEKLVHVPDQLESVKEKLDVFDARIGRIMDDCSNKQQDIENVSCDLADKVVANTDTFEVISADQDQKTSSLRELETRMQTLEADSCRHVKDFQKQVEKGETNLRILCQMLNDRLTPVEQLRTCLNQSANTRDKNVRQLTQVMQEVAVMSPRLQQLELKSSRTRCGFTAGALLLEQAPEDTIRPFEAPDCNVGGNFDADSGKFTAPVDGLYVAAISGRLLQDGSIEVSVRYNKQDLGQSLPTDVCWSVAEAKGIQACNVGVVDMKAGDILYAYVDRPNPACIEYSVRFSCFLLA